jgi:hypothetical protein
MKGISWPIIESSTEDISRQLRRRIVLAFALEGGNTVAEAKRILEKISDEQDRQYFATLADSGYTALRTDLEILGILQPARINRHLFSEFLIKAIEDELFRKPWEQLQSFFARQTQWVFCKLVVLPSHLNRALEYDEEVDSRDAFRAGRLWSKTLAHFGLLAAHYVHEFLRGAEFIGVTYGQTLGATVSGLELLSADPYIRRYSQSVRAVFPLAANVERTPSRNDLNSTAVAGRLAQCLGLTGQALSLAKVSPNATMRELARLKDADFKKIYAGDPDAADPRSLISKGDAIITSAGALSDDGRWHDDYIRRWPTTTVRASDVVGDIGGALIPADLSRDGRFEPGRPGWIGLSRQMLRVVAERGAPGVILVAAGTNKAKAIQSSILDKTVSVAVIDQDAADEILKGLSISL